MKETKRGGYRQGSGAKPKHPAEVASVRIVANVTKVANVVPSNLGKVDLWSAQTVGALQYQAGQQWLLTTQLAPVMLAYTGQ